MSELDEDLELRALQRELDDAFETTRPRPGFDDELWMRMQARRPLWTRVRDALAGLGQGVREAPAVPAAAVAALLVVAVGVGIFQFSGIGRPGANTASEGAPADRNGAATAGGDFGFLPAPQTVAPPKASQPAFGIPDAGADEYAGPVQLAWNGKLDVGLASAPVYRYQEPSATAADAFASSLGAALNGRPAGLLGTYTASTYSLSVRGTLASPPVSPAYFMLSMPAMPDVAAAGASPQDVATIFLAEHSLIPQWTYTVTSVKAGDLIKVRFVRQFTAGGVQAPLVDGYGNGYGLEVDLRGNHPVLVTGILPLDLVGASYPVLDSGTAIQRALKTSTPGAPAVQLTQGALVYVLVPAGDHSFYEPAYLFSGSFKLNGSTYVKHVLVPAVGQ